MSFFNIPNTLTMMRILIVPIFVMALIYGKYRMALSLFVIATITDALDGLIARKTGQKTPIGAFLDPLADKVILMTSFIILAILKWIPYWLVIIVISRDLIVIIGWVVLYIITGSSRVDVSPFGKAAIATQFLLIAYKLFAINFPRHIPQPSNEIYLLVGLVTAISGIHYIYRALTQQDEK
ncbi:MAG: CDP-diacylglycerol--glycerol-3-phosphate 3-phosphatidyltransferase [Thermodesulfovibrionales bacterium]